MTQSLGVILAGGLATRMGGGDKGLLSLGGQSLMARVIDRLSPQVRQIALNANGTGLLGTSGCPYFEQYNTICRFKYTYF